MKDPYLYPGKELLLFQHAHRWKNYWASQVRPYIKGKILEVGAGLGTNIAQLSGISQEHRVLLEPDDNMHEVLLKKKAIGSIPANCEIVHGTIEDIKGRLFDTILYIDVLEHIQKDDQELAKASATLAPGGFLIVLSPAYPFLYSPFDKAIGHYRRYTRRNLKKIQPDGLNCIKTRYLDSIGFFASLANLIFLRQSYPTLKQVYLWDKWMIPASTITDRLFLHSFGKSILAIWQKTP